VTHFYALSPKPVARFHWKHARLSLFRLNPTCQVSSKSIQVSEDLLAKTTFQIVTIIGSDQIADNYYQTDLINTIGNITPTLLRLYVTVKSHEFVVSFPVLFK